MPNYIASDTIGSSYQRPSTIIISNKIDSTPSITFIEEQVINLDNESITRPLGALPFNLENLSTLIPFRNGDELTEESVTIEFIKNSILSLYRYIAELRDIKASSPSEPDLEVRTVKAEVTQIPHL